MKIELYTSENCVNCRKMKKILPTILNEFGLNYDNDVVQKDVNDTAVLADLIMLDTEVIPTIHLNNKTISGEEAINESALRKFFINNISPK